MWKLLVLFAIVACGRVVPLTDAHQVAHDAPRSPDAPGDSSACSGTQLSCGTGCINPLTDNQHCGTCTTACSTPAQGCLAGSCVDASASCAIIHGLDPNAPSGAYTHMADGKLFYCDMTRGLNGGPAPTQYDVLAFGQFNVAQPGYDMMAIADLADPIIVQAFITLYNHQGGGAMTLAPGWNSTNCCFKAADSGAMYLGLGGSYLYPATVGGMTQQCSTIYSAAGFTFFRVQAMQFGPLTLPADYFTTNPPMSLAGCTDGNNPAFFWKRH